MIAIGAPTEMVGTIVTVRSENDRGRFEVLD